MFSSTPTLGPTQPPTEGVPEALCPGVKRQGREADPSPLSGAEVKNDGVYLHSPTLLHGVARNQLRAGTTYFYNKILGYRCGEG
jgi:hypothetical protein